jgi:hypothetical protein
MIIYKGENQLTDFLMPIEFSELESAELVISVGGSEFKTYTLADTELRQGDDVNALRFELTEADSSNLSRGNVTARIKLVAPNALFLVDTKEINIEVAQLFTVQ